MFCFKCGADVSARDSVCPVCGASVNQTQKEKKLSSPYERASFSARATAFGLDVIILLLAWFVLFSFTFVISFYLLPILYLVYYTVTVGGRHAASLGQRWMNICVVDTKTGDHPGYVRAFVWAIASVLSVGAIGLGCFLCFITGGRMLHDLLSGTQTIEKPEK